MDTNYWKNKIDKTKNEIIDYMPTVIISIFIYVIFYVVAKYYKNYIIRQIKYIPGEQNSNLNKQIIIYYQLAWTIYYLILFSGIIFSLMNLGLNIGAILTILGTMGLAFGFAIQDSLKNIISGIYIGLYELFEIGDKIELKSISSNNVTTGTVIDFNLYNTIIHENGGKITIVPNLLIQSNILSNLTKQ